jgi:hypothetical protein
VKKMAELFKELGFKKDSSIEVQRAFFQHLIRISDRSTHKNPLPFVKQMTKTEIKAEQPAQLSFDPEILKAGNN